MLLCSTGVLTKTLSGVSAPADGTGDCSNCRKYLGKTYDDWKAKRTAVYLATVIEATSSRARSSQDLVVHVGNEATWKGYHNGPLDANRNYQ